jgi:hypothetical protein
MPHGISNKPLEKFLTNVPWTAVIKKAEHAAQGTRLWPANKNKDAESNFRLDKGADLGDGKFEVILQANKGAEDLSVKKAARKDSHQIIAKAAADPKNDAAGDQTKNELKGDFKARW